MRGLTRGIFAALAVSLALATGASAADPVPYEDRADSFRNILPPGSNGNATLADIAAFMANNDQRPPHSDDQLQMYEDLVYATPGLKRSQIDDFFKDASFGVPSGEVEREYDPCPPLDQDCPDVVIQRDEGFGVPHISGGTRSGAMFGAGYVAGEDRLFFIDVLRHVGRAQLSSFVGGSAGNRAMDREQWSFAPYTEGDLQRQIDQFDELYGATGAQLQEDLENYVDGVNAYIDEVKGNPLKQPGEYAAINQPQGPEEWKETDVVAIAALVGGIFGKGGGREVDSSLVLQAAQKEFGSGPGEDVWSDFRSAEDKEAPTTVEERFPYQKPPDEVDEGSLGIPDRGTVDDEPVVESSSDGQSAKVGAQPATEDALGGTLAFPSGNSNALVVSGAESSSGHPLAVFGPQTGYFAPQILMEQDIHAPDSPDGPPIDARGVSFPGTNLYVQLGRGDDYSWSATSAGQDNVDTFAVDLCDPDGGEPRRSSRFYEFRGDCLEMEALRRTNQWEPNAADQTPPGSETLRTFRTKLGLVTHRGKIDGDPVAYTSLRSTYLHEVDSAIGFANFNNPDKIDDARDYQRAAFDIGYTFNWLYVDDQDVAYFNSGNNPERAEDTDPNFPTRGKRRYEWKDYKPGSNQADYTPFSEHPQIVNKEYLTSWNNKQAPAYRASDANFGFSAVYRSQPLDDRIEDGIRGGKEMSLHELIDAMEDAGTVDLRGDKVLPLALRILGDQGNDNRAAAIDDLRAWVEDGAHRRDRDESGEYEHSRAIRIMDAWWPILIKKEFKPELGSKLYERLTGMLDVDNEPNNHGAHLGSAYQGGWYGFASKDLRTVLGRSVDGEYSREYCGRGQLSRCRERLENSLSKALKNDDPAELYQDDICEDEGESGDQMCFDKVFHRPLGAITQPLIHWINRPTFQQAVEIQGGDAAAAGKREGRRPIGPQDEAGTSEGESDAAASGPAGDE